ncbi:MAG: 30S ribosomal protein S2 [Candidatus Liptonbacteria bacterium]|nr:30S ribosomal protein S2 [Candidatus Liptonbacteria bacterium]
MIEESTIDKEGDLFPEESLKEVVEAGVFYGRKKTKTHPKMKPYVLTNRGGIEIINLYKTLEGLEQSMNFVKAKAQGVILLLGTQPAAFQRIVKLAQEFGYPYVVSRWLGGTLTNFKIISKRVEYLKKLRADAATGVFEKYTKKERAIIESKMNHLEEVLGGLENLNRLPDVLLVVDPNLHTTAVREAKRLKIPVLAFANIDGDPSDLDYFVVGNNKSRKSVEWFLGKMEQAMREGKSATPAGPVMPVEETAVNVS